MKPIETDDFFHPKIHRRPFLKTIVLGVSKLAFIAFAVSGVFKMSVNLNQHRLLLTVFYLNFNLICSTVLVLLNKWIYVNVGFPNMTLTLCHFVTTYLGLNVCERFNVFQVKTVPVKDVCLLSATFCGFVIFTNLSLQYNTVGTYQLAKVTTTPVVVLLQILFYKKNFSFKIKCTLLPTVAGVFINFYYDIKFNYIGTLCATVGIFITSLYQIMVNSKQKELQMDPMQLLYYQAPLSSVMLLPIILLFENPLKITGKILSLNSVAMILSSCLIAFFINVSIYWIIGKTSPLTYNMFGHLKFCLTALGGYLLFNEPISFIQFFGVILTLFGVTYYGHLKLKERPHIIKSLEEG